MLADIGLPFVRKIEVHIRAVRDHVLQRDAHDVGVRKDGNVEPTIAGKPLHPPCVACFGVQLRDFWFVLSLLRLSAAEMVDSCPSALSIPLRHKAAFEQMDG